MAQYDGMEGPKVNLQRNRHRLLNKSAKNHELEERLVPEQM